MKKSKGNKMKDVLKINMSTKGITLISLVVTIIVLIILAGISINLILGDNGIIQKSKQASSEHEKQAATEKMNLKITNIQIGSYAEKGELPNLQYLADGLCKDEEMEYVALETKKTASLQPITVGDATSIFTKLKEYPYEFEINSSLQLASVDGVQIATSNDSGYEELKAEIQVLKGKIEQQQSKIDALEENLKTQDITSSMQLNSDYVSPRTTVKLTKSGNTICMVAYLNVLQDIPTNTPIITIDPEYTPKNGYVASVVLGGNEVRYLNINTGGNVYIAANISQTTFSVIQIETVWQIEE